MGDGAGWIVGQVKQKFGEQARYLVDFYHMSGYLAAAAKPIAGAEEQVWLRQQQQRMKENHLSEVLAEIGPKVESQEVDESLAPVRACERYLITQK